MSERKLSTPRYVVFGDVEKGTECRICGRNVEDGRRKTCSEYCDSILRNVMSLLNWDGVRRRVIERDDRRCVECGFRREWVRTGNDHIQALIDERLPEQPTLRWSLTDLKERDQEEFRRYLQASEAWRRYRDHLRDRFGHPWKHDERYELQVDHITPVADGGHPFDPANLQTLCADCHNRKTALENSERAEQEPMDRPEIELIEFSTGGGS